MDQSPHLIHPCLSFRTYTENLLTIFIQLALRASVTPTQDPWFFFDYSTSNLVPPDIFLSHNKDHKDISSHVQLNQLEYCRTEMNKIGDGIQSFRDVTGDFYKLDHVRKLCKQTRRTKKRAAFTDIVLGCQEDGPQEACASVAQPQASADYYASFFQQTLFIIHDI